MNSPGAISPPIGMSMPGEFSISNTQSRFYGNTQYSTHSMRGTGFLGMGSHMKQSFYEDYDSRMMPARTETKRPKPKIIYRKTESSDEEENEQFHANPAEDIPHNKLVDKLVRGLQSYIQRMQKRESFRLEVKVPHDPKWMPAPRECSTLTTVGYNMYLIGGLNYDVCKEIIRAKVNGDTIIWERIPYTSSEVVQGRQCHTAVPYQSKIYMFGGCFMFHKKRQVRECTN